MDEGHSESFSSSYSHLSSPKTHTSKPSGSGLTLVIPSLKSLKASQSSTIQKKPKSQQATTPTPISTIQDAGSVVQERKVSRPAKLKPLKEVLSRLISQIKKKDDYAFFLAPVNASNVAGYSDVIKFPMDFGTMTDKVNRGKYRSLEDFASDFRLVTMNAKIFNPPGSIYHTEADRIEVWGVDHINRAASTVIQNETDWSIDVENDDDEQPVVVDRDDDDNVGTPMDVDAFSTRDRSVSVAPSQQQSLNRRTTRGPIKKTAGGPSNLLSESLEPEGGLPGSKDGLGAFPAGSEWAKTMLALKLKGKRYKTKKERMRIERSGPPLLPDGSLDYTEMEDPFSVLSFFVADSRTRPQLVPVYQPLYTPGQSVASDVALSLQVTASQTSETPRAQSQVTLTQPATFPSATSLTPNYTLPSLPFLSTPLPSDAPGSTSTSQPHFRRRHWVINRNSTSRQKGKEKDEDQPEDIEPPTWETPREAHAVDFGTFGVLAGALAEEMQKRGLSTSNIRAAGGDLHEGVDQEVTYDLLKASLDLEAKMQPETADGGGSKDDRTVVKPAVPQEFNATNLLTHGYWTDQRAIEAEEYLKDVVYGGIDGVAYARSLAEFLAVKPALKDRSWTSTSDENDTLAIPVTDQVVEDILDSLTEGRHALLRETARQLILQQNKKPFSITADPRRGTVSTQVTASLFLFPATLIALSSLLHIRLHKIDMGSLLKTPQELFLSEEEWAGKGIKEKRRRTSGTIKQEAHSDKAVDVSTLPVSELASDAMEVEEAEQTWVGVDADVTKGNTNSNRRLTEYEIEGPEELREVLEYVSNVIIEVDKRTRKEKAHVGALGRPNSNGPSQETGRLNDQESGDTPKADVKQMPSSNGTSIAADAPSTKTTNAIQSTTNTAIQLQNGSSLPEDPVLRNLRLNLLALAKRAPLDTIARLPKDLVPEHIRHFVPTFGPSG